MTDYNDEGALVETEVKEANVQEAPAAAPKVAAAEASKTPVTVLQDVYGDKYKLNGCLPNGCLSVLRSQANAPWTLLPIPAYPGTDCVQLSDLYVLTRTNADGDEKEIDEILLPASEINNPDDTRYDGVLLPRDLSACVRGDQWHPDWLSTDRLWQTLACVADGVEVAGSFRVFPFKLTRDRLFVDEAAGQIYLVIARAGRVTAEMRQDPWLAAVLPPELKAPGQEQVEAGQTAYALAALILSLLRDWVPSTSGGALIEADEAGHIAEAQALPVIFPQRDEIVALLTRAFGDKPEERPAPGEWRDLLNRCADEMLKRLPDASNDPNEDDEDDKDSGEGQTPFPGETIAAAMASEDGYLDVVSQRGGAWLLGGDEQPVREARWRFKAFRLPNPQWQLWEDRLDELSLAQRRRFSVLRFPVDCLQQDGEWYMCFEGQAPAHAEGFQWSGFQDPSRLRQDLDGALRLVAALIEDLKLANDMGVNICALSMKQLVNIPEAAIVLCGQNLMGKNPISPTSVVKKLFAKLAGSTQLSPEMNRMLVTQASLDAWMRMLRFAADHIRQCPKCAGKQMPGAICPDCGYAVLPFEVRRDVTPEDESVFLDADGVGIVLSQLYPGAPDEPALSLTWAPAQGCFCITNLGNDVWKCVAGGQVGTIAPHQTVPLTPLMRVAILYRKLEIKYAWPV